MEQNLLEIISRRALVCDGAMGTQLIARGLQPGTAGELWNVERPDDVEAIHLAYIEAGCDLITTNTFGATSTSLARHGLDARVEQINRQAATIARRAAGDGAFVLGDVGPFGDFLEPLGDVTVEQLTAIFRQQIDALYEGGADAIVIETMSDPAELATAVRAAKAVSPKPVIATYAFGKADANFRTMMGVATADAVRQAIDAGADVVGANCGTALTLDDYRGLAEQLVSAAGGKPVILQPNAGSPETRGGKLHYAATPAEMAELASDLRRAGVRIVGGCCGTSPEHLKSMAGAIGKQG